MRTGVQEQTLKQSTYQIPTVSPHVPVQFSWDKEAITKTSLVGHGHLPSLPLCSVSHWESAHDPQGLFLLLLLCPMKIAQAHVVKLLEFDMYFVSEFAPVLLSS